MKRTVLIISVICLCVCVLNAQVLYNTTTITIQSGATVYVKGGVVNQTNGTFSNDGTLYISGDITQSGNNAFTATGSTGTVELNGTALQNFSGSGSGNLNFYNLTMNNSAGAQLSRDIIVSNNLTMTSGNINLNGNNIDLLSTGTIVNETNANRIYGTSGVITTLRNINAPTNLNIGGMGIELTTTANLGSTLINRGHAQQSNVGGGTSILRYFDISPTNNSGLNATMRFHYFDANELNGQNENFLQLYRSPDGGVTWTFEGGTAFPLSDYVELSGINAFSRWTLSDNSLLLPITLLDFQARPDGKGHVLLNWSTANEVNSDHFEIERSEDGYHFEWVKNHAANGNTTTFSDYSDIDMQPYIGRSFYRLRLVDQLGNITYSPIRQVWINEAATTVSVAPNPAPVNSQIHVTVEYEGDYSWELYDNITGQKVQSLINLPGYGSTQLIGMEKLAAGVYTWRIITGADNQFSGKLILIK